LDRTLIGIGAGDRGQGALGPRGSGGIVAGGVDAFARSQLHLGSAEILLPLLQVGNGLFVAESRGKSHDHGP
jgi:hypothetical protein